MAEFQHQELLPLGPDTSPYRKLSGADVSALEAAGKTFLSVEASALTVTLGRSSLV